MISPRVCDHPFDITFFSDGRYHAEKCQFPNSGRLSDGPIDGQLTTAETNELKNRIDRIASQDLSNRDCQPSETSITMHKLTLRLSSGGDSVLIDTGPGSPQCTRGKKTDLDDLEQYLHLVIDKHFPMNP